jgi:ribose transport system permease protein
LLYLKQETIDRFSTLSPSVVAGEIMQKRWSEALAPFTLLLLSIGVSVVLIEDYLSFASLMDNARAFSEFLFVTLAMALILLGGGIDLSVGSIFCLANFTILLLLGYYELPIWGASAVTLLVGGAVGLWNGLLVGYVKTRPLITTMTTLIVIGASVRILDQRFSLDLASVTIDDSTLEFLGAGRVFGIPVNAIALTLTVIATHLVLSRSRFGAHVYATGGDRKAALHAGIDVRRVQLATFVAGGVLAAVGGIFYAARLGSPTPSAGAGWEITILAALVVGGLRLTGGRGSVLRAMIGGITIQILTNTLVRFGVAGAEQTMIIGTVALASVAAEVRYSKNRARATDMIYIAPARRVLGLPSIVSRSTGGPLQVNDELRDVMPYCEGEAVGPGDMLFDSRGDLYVSSSEGWILRYTKESFYRQRSYWAHVGGYPLGMQLDRDGTIVAAVVGRGLFRVDQSGQAVLLTNQTERSRLAIRDDSRIRVPTALDITSSGDIYFGEGTSRYEWGNWLRDAIEARANGALLKYSPDTGRTTTVRRGLPFCGGVCLAHDGDRILVSLSWQAAIFEYHISGPNRGRYAPFVQGLPGYPMMITRGSNDTYWVAVAGLRSPAFNLAMKYPALRRRMTRLLPPDEWMLPNFNVGLVLKLDSRGQVIQSFWDVLGRHHHLLTSVREYAGHLWMASWNSAKIGRKALSSSPSDLSAQAAIRSARSSVGS